MLNGIFWYVPTTVVDFDKSMENNFRLRPPHWCLFSIFFAHDRSLKNILRFDPVLFGKAFRKSFNDYDVALCPVDFDIFGLKYLNFTIKLCDSKSLYCRSVRQIFIPTIWLRPVRLPSTYKYRSPQVNGRSPGFLEDCETGRQTVIFKRSSVEFFIKK